MIDYKKIVKSRRLRLAILSLLSFIPDKWMIKIQYRIKTGRKLNLKNPKRFTEKLQWYKLYYRDPLMKNCVDKYEVRHYVELQGFSSCLNECFGVFNSPEEIDFDKLPNQFVLKDTLGGGGISVIVCKDKASADLNQYRSIMKNWTKPTSRKSYGREWVYEGRKHRIIAEKYIESKESQGGLIDYKFFCFNGKAEFMYVISERTLGGLASFGIYDADFNRLDVRRKGEYSLSTNIIKPQNFDEMKIVAEKLAEKFPEARIDLYSVDSKVIFGEITFFSGSGYIEFDPDEFDFELGSRFTIN